jgi:hypothetical protein
MRDVGILVWVVLLIVGVIGSMISSLRRQAQGQLTQLQRPPLAQGPRPAPAPEQLPPWLEGMLAQIPAPATRVSARPAPPQPKPVPPAPAPAPAVEHPHPQVEPAARRRFFPARRDVVRAVIAAEVLGKPRGLSDEYFPR